MGAKVIHFPTRVQLNADTENPDRGDFVGPAMLVLYSKIMAEPVPPHMMNFCLSRIPVGRFDDSKMWDCEQV